MSLWGDEFVIEETPKVARRVIKKVREPKEPKVVTSRTIKSKTVSIHDKIELIRQDVYKILGRYEDSTQVITDRDELHRYITKAIENGIIAIDTETNNSLQPVSCKLMGACIYTPGLKNVYIPVNHVDPDTNVKLENQLTERDIFEEFSRLDNRSLILTHNGKFDYEVLKCTTGWKMNIYWDTLIGARILNENEKANLKLQYITHVDPTVEKYSIEHLFEGVLYEVLDPKLFALYAATDALMTYKLYQYQKKEFEKSDNARIYKLFREIEMPAVEVFAEMELTGVELSMPYAQRLKIKYGRMLENLQVKIDAEFKKYDKQIEAWRNTPEANYRPPKKDKPGEYDKSLSEKLQVPINTGSPLQMAVFFYDVLKMPVVDKKKPRGTGEDILEQFKLPICDLILQYRGLSKLISTYIDALPNAVNEVDGRVHGNFNQIGAGTGRVSSDNPNLQNIPSSNRELRLLFKARDGYMMVGGDFSQQEPRLLAIMSQDTTMKDAYLHKKDLYATVAAKVYHNGYWDNMESHEDGTPNPEGKKRRSNIKSVVLGIMYGRGAPSIAEQIGSSIEEAQKIVNDFFDGFPKVKDWVKATEENAKKVGYVEDFWGRRRRLPDLMLPKYTVKLKDAKSTSDFNPILYTKGIITKKNDPRIDKYTKLINDSKGRKAYSEIKSAAEKEGVIVTDNGAFIAQAERQCVNARIQGSAATMTKIAMRKIYDDKILNELGFKLQLTVHDEVIGECPQENADKCAERLSYVMSHCIEEYTDMPFKSDCEIEFCWYLNTYQHDLMEEIDMLVKTHGKDKAIELFKQIHNECNEQEAQENLDMYFNEHVS